MDFKAFKEQLSNREIQYKDEKSLVQVEFRCPFFEHRIVPKKKDAIVKKKRKGRIYPAKPIFFVGRSGYGVCLLCRKEISSFEAVLAELDAVRAMGRKPNPKLLPCFVCNKRIATVSVPVEGKHLGVNVESGLPEMCMVCREDIIWDHNAKEALLPYCEEYFSDGEYHHLLGLIDELERIKPIKPMVTRDRIESMIETSGRILKKRDPVYTSLFVYKWIKPSTQRANSNKKEG